MDKLLEHSVIIPNLGSHLSELHPHAGVATSDWRVDDLTCTLLFTSIHTRNGEFFILIYFINISHPTLEMNISTSPDAADVRGCYDY